MKLDKTKKNSLIFSHRLLKTIILFTLKMIV